MYEWLIDGLAEALLDSREGAALWNKINNSFLKGYSTKIKLILNKYFGLFQKDAIMSRSFQFEDSITPKDKLSVKHIAKHYKMKANKDIKKYLMPKYKLEIKQELKKHIEKIKKAFTKTPQEHLANMFRSITKVTTQDGKIPKQTYTIVSSTWIRFLKYRPSKVPYQGYIDAITKDENREYSGTLLKPWSYFYRAATVKMIGVNVRTGPGTYDNNGAGNVLWEWAKRFGDPKRVLY